MNYTVEMRSGAIVYTPRFIKTGSGTKKLIMGGYTYRQTERMVIS
jgi:hypothetical protein